MSAAFRSVSLDKGELQTCLVAWSSAVDEGRPGLDASKGAEGVAGCIPRPSRVHSGSPMAAAARSC